MTSHSREPGRFRDIRGGGCRWLCGVAAVAAVTLAATPRGAAQVYRAGTDVVVIDASVMDGRRPVTTLGRDDFELRDNGVVQRILDFDHGKLPLDVSITIDISGSMTAEKRATVERAIAQVNATLGPGDRGAVTTFAGRMAESSALAPPPLTVNLAPPRGGTSVVDALLLALVTVATPDRRQLHLFMTDGEDTSSYFDTPTVNDLARYASGQTSILLVRDGKLDDRSVMAMFRTVASTTGGEIFELGDRDDLSRAFLDAIETFRTSYVLQYTPTGVSATGWHDVSVSVKGRRYSVRARRGYWRGPARQFVLSSMTR